MSIPALFLNRGILADAHMAIAARTTEKNKASPELAYLYWGVSLKHAVINAQHTLSTSSLLLCVALPWLDQ
jgi:hypothetical protein